MAPIKKRLIPNQKKQKIMFSVSENNIFICKSTYIKTKVSIGTDDVLLFLFKKSNNKTKSNLNLIFVNFIFIFLLRLCLARDHNDFNE